MPRSQSSMRGLWGKQALQVGADGVFFSPYSDSVPLLDASSTNLLVAGGVTLNGSAVAITANSTGYRVGSRYITTNTTGNLQN